MPGRAGSNIVTSCFGAIYEPDFASHAHGKIYLTPQYFCFYGKGFMKSAKIILTWDQVKTVDKVLSLIKIPNAVRLVDAHGFKYLFAGFFSSEKVYTA
ncbi:hypothetical protein HDU93_005034, partial [Gonapodya sp. JEL0774]